MDHGLKGHIESGAVITPKKALTTTKREKAIKNLCNLYVKITAVYTDYLQGIQNNLSFM